ncbi:MAG: hypothetical protein U5K73_00215 [Halofilum sp. (in: g-proteobacteria)]|nr:hypothetical protein [Halofilum sp. (in: g-proteobacteria)]
METETTVDALAQPTRLEVFRLLVRAGDAAAERCPAFPGRPITAHWRTDDPAAVAGDDEAVRRAYRRACTDLERRIKLLLNLPLESLDRLAQQRLRAIGNDEQPA